jgi:YD repeat-containing protein
MPRHENRPPVCDRDNRLVKTTRPDSTVLTQSYDAAGQLLEYISSSVATGAKAQLKDC